MTLKLEIQNKNLCQGVNTPLTYKQSFVGLRNIGLEERNNGFNIDFKDICYDLHVHLCPIILFQGHCTSKELYGKYESLWTEGKYDAKKIFQIIFTFDLDNLFFVPVH